MIHRRPGQIVDDLHHLVRLFLVLDQMDLGARVLQQIADLGGGVGRVETNGDAPDRDGGDIEHDPFGPVLGVD